MLSLTLQTFLILYAPLRKRISSKWVTVPIWLAYLLADWAATFGIGLIASNLTNTDQGSPENGNLLAFWAPFLLLHLGGPDTIIAIAMEDNALWPRHLLGLVFQAVAAMYVFGMQFSFDNKLLWPTLLLFVPGLVKYGERTRALYLASLETLKETTFAVEQPAMDYAKYMDEFSSRKAANLPVQIVIEPGLSSDSKNGSKQQQFKTINDFTLVENAHHLFQMSMGLIIDLVFDNHQRRESREYFSTLTAEQAFTSVATELNFMYEALYTKAYEVHSRRGYVLRAASFISVSIALVIFYRLEKHGLHRFDVGITYSLLFGAIALDSIALSMLIFSDWTIAVACKFCKAHCSCVVTHVLKKYLEFKTLGRPTTSKCMELTRKLLFRRWCESVSSFSFIDYSLRECGKVGRDGEDSFGLKLVRFLRHWYLRVIIFLGLKCYRDELKYRSSKRLPDELWPFIFRELKAKSEHIDDLHPEMNKQICSSQGDWVLLTDYSFHPEYKNLISCFVGVSYDRRVLLWHIATEMCFYTDDDTSNENRSYSCISKTLSDYMLYLLIMQPVLMYSITGIGQKRFRDTVAEAQIFFKKRRLLGSDMKPREAYRKLLAVETSMKPVNMKVNSSRTVLFDACILAKQLMQFKELKWELMSAVWVDLLSYAASHCRAYSHAQLLTEGGELVTFVWLLMARFGIEEIVPALEDVQFPKVPATIKLITGK